MRVPQGFTRRLFMILSAWLVVRTAFAAVDGTLAIEFGQKSRLGGILNESGDVFSDVALFLPLALVSLFSAVSITALIFLAMFEFVGLAGTMLSGTHRARRPAWKSRSIDRARACGDSDRRLWPASRRRVVRRAGALRRAGRHHLESLALRARRAGGKPSNSMDSDDNNRSVGSFSRGYWDMVAVIRGGASVSLLIAAAKLTRARNLLRS